MNLNRSGIGKVMLIILAICFLTSCASVDRWNVNILGVNPQSFEKRSIPKVLAGAAVSFVVHEAGHYFYAKANGDARLSLSEKSVMWSDYHKYSVGRQQMYHRAGFLSQILTGGILTTIPATRYADFTVGFNGFSTANTALYTVTGDIGNHSDIDQLNRGRLEGTIYTTIFALMLYENMTGKWSIAKKGSDNDNW